MQRGLTCHGVVDWEVDPDFSQVLGPQVFLQGAHGLKHLKGLQRLAQ